MTGGDARDNAHDCGGVSAGCTDAGCGNPRRKGGNLIREKAMGFSERMYHLNEYLIEKRKFSLADQVFRSGTSIGANLSEAVRAESDSDFVHKYSIAMKEAEETRYWLELIWRVGLLDDRMYRSLRNDCDELIKIGTSIMLTMLRKIKSEKQEKA